MNNIPEFKGKIADSNNRNVLKDPLLYCQFLRGYTDIEVFKEIEPDDIEDVSEKYQAYLGIEFEADTVKRVNVKNEEVPFFVISLVEHKSNVYYNVSMQLLKYMVCIWDEYGKEMEQKSEGSVERATFRYPPIIPIVYYEGKGKWTASTYFRDRIYMSDLFREYIPDFNYKLIDVHNYSNEELFERGDEMSLLMSINKVQTMEDLAEFLHSEWDKIGVIISKTPERILQIISSVMWNLCMKINVPVYEAEECVSRIRGRHMGYWFENMDKIDVQEERRKCEEAQREAEEAQRELEETQQELKYVQLELEEVQNELNKTKCEKKNAEKSALRLIIETAREMKADKATVKRMILEISGKSEGEIDELISEYWG